MSSYADLKLIIQGIILDNQQVELHLGVPRRIALTPIPGKASVYMGVRRAGKTTLMSQVMHHMTQQGVPRENILELNFFDDRLHGLDAQSLQLILEAYFTLYPHKKDNEKIYCFFDEIQVIAGFEPFINRLMRTENCEVYLTGSSAHMLSKEIATQLRGRVISWEVFPFSFQEFLDAQSIGYEKPIATKSRYLIEDACNQYKEKGGFPEVVNVENFIRIKIHQEYFNAILFRDLIERHDVAHPKAVLDLAHYLMENIGSFYSINKLTGYLKSRGHHVPKASVSEYVAWFEDAYMLFSIRLFDASYRRAQTNPKKIYCIDHALVRSVASNILVNSGHLLENMVFVALRRASSSIYYYKTQSGREVDFIVQHVDRKKQLIQVCESLSDSQTREREIAALSEAMQELSIEEAHIVTSGEQETINRDQGIIHVVPLWLFLLQIVD